MEKRKKSYLYIMIKLRKICKSYGAGAAKLQVLKEVCLDIRSGEFVSIMGASGSGKSTLLNMIGLLDGFDSGEYLLGNESMVGIGETRAAKVRNHTLGFVFQAFNLIPFKTSLENVTLPLYYRGIHRRKRNAMARKVMETLGIGEKADKFPDELSGGQRQRVAIARALVGEPKVILADEPTGSLDSATSLDVINILKEVNSRGITILLVTHARELAEKSTRIVTIKDGVVIE